ncbi:UNVERIFIED_CONTAM: hypothetical protein NCL1_23262 [Trichonephila clavipes]
MEVVSPPPSSRIVAMVRREREEENWGTGTPRDLRHFGEKLDNCPCLRLSKFLNQMQKEGKSFVKEKQTSSKSSRKCDKKILQIHQVLVPNLHQST